MIDTEQGRRLGDEVWKEMLEIVEKEEPDIREIVSAS